MLFFRITLEAAPSYTDVTPRMSADGIFKWFSRGRGVLFFRISIFILGNARNFILIRGDRFGFSTNIQHAWPEGLNTS